MAEERRDHKIYKYTNKVNGKVYIGRTCRTLKERAGHNGSYYESCPYFWRAIKKYGWDSFEGKIIEEGLSDTEAAVKEIFYINLYESADSKKAIMF